MIDFEQVNKSYVECQTLLKNYIATMIFFALGNYTLFYKQHSHKQRQAEIDKKLDTSYAIPWSWIFDKTSEKTSAPVLMGLSASL